MTGTFDPELNLIYWPTGNPWPDLYGPVRRGDNLNTCSMLRPEAWSFSATMMMGNSWPLMPNLERTSGTTFRPSRK